MGAHSAREDAEMLPPSSYLPRARVDLERSLFTIVHTAVVAKEMVVCVWVKL